MCLLLCSVMNQRADDALVGWLQGRCVHHHGPAVFAEASDATRRARQRREQERRDLRGHWRPTERRSTDALLQARVRDSSCCSRCHARVACSRLPTERCGASRPCRWLARDGGGGVRAAERAHSREHAADRVRGTDRAAGATIRAAVLPVPAAAAGCHQAIVREWSVPVATAKLLACA